ncbi:MAG: alpha-glucan family phosphorylase [Chloroflexi bacterium]|nr:alpha-glucan family phosphorylase [Chloroflexota bacterium]
MLNGYAQGRSLPDLYLTPESYPGPLDAPSIAYFSMEFGLEPAMPTYSGGLGVLAGDTVRAAADIGMPMVGVSLLYRKGYFRQHLDEHGNQIESDPSWSPAQFLELMPPRVLVNVAGRQVQVQAWRYLVRGDAGYQVPVYLLDTALPENSPWDQGITDYLYRGDERYRFCQEAILGIGGVAMLRSLGHHRIQAYHMNEGHSALISLALLEEQTWGRGLRSTTESDCEAVRKRCIFTTHTPVLAGHDVFPGWLVRDVLGAERAEALDRTSYGRDGVLDMTRLALNFSRYVNGVSMSHEKVCHDIYANHPIDAVTNGVHAATWTSPPFQSLFNEYIPEWRRDNLYLRYAISIPLEEIWRTHSIAKQALLKQVEARTGLDLDPSILTIGFGRRATPYKRTDLFFHDMERLLRIAREAGKVQVICGGKAHPRDESGKHLIRRIVGAGRQLQDAVPVVYLEEYDMALAKYLCSGVDLWLNTPQKPQEASGTSGMKAALNGVPSFSTLDGWWVEGHIEGVTGWSIGSGSESEAYEAEVGSLYDKLENVIIPMYYRQPEAYARMMRSAIALNGSFFNTQRMLLQYLQNAYLRAGRNGGNGRVTEKTVLERLLK